jgi:hypothetical protein
VRRRPVDHRLPPLSAVAVTLRREHHVEVDRETTAAARRLLTDYVRDAAERGAAEQGRGHATVLVAAINDGI